MTSVYIMRQQSAIHQSVSAMLMFRRYDCCSGACDQSKRCGRGSAGESVAPSYIRPHVLSLPAYHNNTMPYTSQEDHLQYLPHELHTSNPAIKIPKRP
jgi:hypothetical protein